MAELIITPGQVRQQNLTGAPTRIAGEVVTAGRLIYFDQPTSRALEGKTTSVESSALIGMSLASVVANQPVPYIGSGILQVDDNPFALGESYFLSNGTPGTLMLRTDAVGGEFMTFAGFAIATNLLKLSIVSAGVALP